MNRRRFAVLGAVGAVAGLLVASTRPWLSGRTSDPVVGGSLVVATGSQAAPAAVALVVVGLAALVAALTAGPRARAVATVVLLASAAATAYAVARVLLDPGAALAARAAEQAGRTGPVTIEASVTPWVGFALGCAVAFVGFAILLAAASRGARGLSGRFDRPAGRPERDRSSWDALTAGEDPTAGPDTERT